MEGFGGKKWTMQYESLSFVIGPSDPFVLKTISRNMYSRSDST
jgi:hypothetical protein